MFTVLGAVRSSASLVNLFEARRLRFNMEKVSAIGVELDGRIRALDMNPVALNASGRAPLPAPVRESKGSRHVTRPRA